MIKTLIFVVAVSVLAESIQSTSDVVPSFRKSRFIAPKVRAARQFNLNSLTNNINTGLSSLTNALSNGDLQNNINTGVNTLGKINDALNNLKIEVPQLDANSLVKATNPLDITLSPSDLKLLTDLVNLNVQFLVARAGLDATTTNLLLEVVPQLLSATTQAELQAILDPLILTGLGIFFQDPYIIFSQHPYLEATKRVLNMFFASPEAPEFLKDPLVQAMVLEYVDKYFATNDPLSAITLAAMDVFMYANVASGQEIKPLVQMYLPELYVLIENETDLEVMFNIVYSYAVTQAVVVYNMVLNLFTDATSSSQGMAQVMQAAIKFGQRVMVQNRK